MIYGLYAPNGWALWSVVAVFDRWLVGFCQIMLSKSDAGVRGTSSRRVSALPRASVTRSSVTSNMDSSAMVSAFVTSIESTSAGAAKAPMGELEASTVDFSEMAMERD